MAGRKSRPHLQSLGSGPSSGTFVGSCCGCGSCSWCQGEQVCCMRFRTAGNSNPTSSSVFILVRSTAMNMPWSLLKNYSSGLVSASAHCCPASPSSALWRLASSQVSFGPGSQCRETRCSSPHLFLHPGHRDSPLRATTDSGIRPQRRRHGGHVDRAPSLIALASSMMSERKGSPATFHAPHHHRRWLSSSLTPLSQ